MEESLHANPCSNHTMGFILRGGEACSRKDGLETSCEGDDIAAKTSVNGH